MTTCPKCCSGNIVGPRYVRYAYGIESLVYRCIRCGYSERESTRDSQTPQSLADLRAAAWRRGTGRK